MSIPKLAKYTASGAIYDSAGQRSVDYIASYSTETDIYFLTSKTGDVTKYNFVTEQETLMKAVTGGNSYYDVDSIIAHNDVVYGFKGRLTKKFTENKVLYIYNTLDETSRSNKDYLVYETYDFAESGLDDKSRCVKSENGIENFVIDRSNNIYVLHGGATKPHITKYNSSFVPLFKIDLLQALTELTTTTLRLLSVDIVREYTDKGLKQYPIVLLSVSSELAMLKIDEVNQTVYDFTLLGVKDNYYKYSDTRKQLYNLTNYTYLKENHPEQQFTFKVRLKNVQNNRSIEDVSIPVDISMFTTGWHHFALRLDTNQGNISVFVDGKLYTNVTIPPMTYTFQNIIQDGIAIGCTGFYNNTPLFKYLNQPGYYFVDNCSVKQFKLYDVALKDDEIRFLTFNGIKMQDGIMSLPADQRNELDQIERVFKLDAPGHKSNNINILIKNSQIEDSPTQEKIKNIVRQKLAQILPANVNINDITFNKY
jgi:hypothetical protein